MLVVNHNLFEILIGVLLEKTKGFLSGKEGRNRWTDTGTNIFYLGSDLMFDFQKDDDGKTRRLYYVIYDLK